LHLEKRWIKSTKKIEIPINYEEMYMNGKEFDSYSHNEVVEIISKVKEKITEVLNPKQTEEEQNQTQNREDGDDHHYPNDLDIKLQKDESTAIAKMDQSEYESNHSEKRPSLPISEADTNRGQIQVSGKNNNDLEEEQVIPLWGEQIIIDKKMIRLGEIVIKKSKISEKRKIDIDVRKEKVTVKYPDNKKQETI
jgi:stress response protein YsnF